MRFRGARVDSIHKRDMRYEILRGAAERRGEEKRGCLATASSGLLNAVELLQEQVQVRDEVAELEVGDLQIDRALEEVAGQTAADLVELHVGFAV